MTDVIFDWPRQLLLLQMFRCHDPPGFEVYCMMGGLDRDDVR